MLSPHLILVQRFVSHVKRQQQQSALPQYALHFPKYRRQRFLRNIDNRIEGRDARQRRVLKIQRQHVSFAEGNVGIELSRLLQHSRRQIETKNTGARLAQIARDVTRPAAHVAHFPDFRDFSREAIEQLPVEWLVPKLVENPARVLIRELIVTFPNRVCDVVAHVLPSITAGYFGGVRLGSSRFASANSCFAASVSSSRVSAIPKL